MTYRARARCPGTPHHGEERADQPDDGEGVDGVDLPLHDGEVQDQEREGLLWS